MIPNDLQFEFLDLPATDNHSIVLITSNELRHRRFALRLISEFGDQVVAWYQCENTAPLKYRQAGSSDGNSGLGLKGKLRKTVKDGRKFARRPGVISTLIAVMRALVLKWRWQRHKRLIRLGEQRMFGAELQKLAADMNRSPVLINPKDVNTDEFRSEIRELDPYFFLSLAGPLYGKKLLDTIRGIAINQHAGHSPGYKGTSTIEWALYHRDLNCVSSTVHQTTPGADEGPILRRSQPCLFPEDSPATIFSKVVALGTELMIEVVREIIADKHVRVFPQPVGEGKTYLGSDMTPHVLQSIYRDYRAGWLHDEYMRMKRF